MVAENEVAKHVVESAYRVHTQLGPGLLESVYEQVMAYELTSRGLTVRRQQLVPVMYDNIRMATGFRVDLMVEDLVIVEIKSVLEPAPVHFKQLLTYLRLSDRRLGLMLNFGGATMKPGIRRVVNGLYARPDVGAQSAAS
jgi:GxxExxY protein